MNILKIRLQKTRTMFRHRSDVFDDGIFTVGSLEKGRFKFTGRIHNDHIYATHWEKRRGHWANTGSTRPLHRSGHKDVWVPTTWTRTVTRIPLELMKYLPHGSYFVQHKNHWELVTAR